MQKIYGKYMEKKQTIGCLNVTRRQWIEYRSVQNADWMQNAD